MSTNHLFSLRYPIGKFEWTTNQPSSKEKKEVLSVLKNFPALVQQEVEGLKELLDALTRGSKQVLERIDQYNDRRYR